MTDSSNTSHYDLDRLKAIPFGSVVEKVDTLRRKGCRYVTYCPWHEDRHPSLTLYEGNDENRCHCFACGQGGSTIDYIMAHEGLSFRDACRWLSNEFGIPTTNGTVTIHKHQRKDRKITPVAYTYVPMHIVESYMHGQDSFSRCLYQLFDPMLVRYVADEYMLGCYESWKYSDNVVFPSIDRWGRVHNLKTQHYCTDIQSPQFCHCDKNHILWLGSILSKNGTLPKDARFDNNCFFGEHLLNRYPSATVALVESPKNAIIGACYLPKYVWIAAGSMNMLTREMLQTLNGRRVIAIPDSDALDAWECVFLKNRDIADVAIPNNFLTRIKEKGAKADIADIILDEMLMNKG